MAEIEGLLSNGIRLPALMGTDSTVPEYWLNWRVLLCVVWILVAIVFAALLIWRYEGGCKSNRSRDQEAVGYLYKGDVWGTCSRSIHPIWLLAYRVVAFCALLAVLLVDSIARGGHSFYFYTQWTFTLVTIYFGLGSSLSVYGCLHYFHKAEPETDCIDGDESHGSYRPPTLGEYVRVHGTTGSLNCCNESNCTIPASGWEYSLQIVFQMCAGAVVLTDFVFWLIIYPILTPRSYKITILVVCMHSVNAVFLLGDSILNRLQFPFFRIAYFILWTCTFVVFQWIIHACVSLRWPYIFLDLSSPYAPLWYVAIGLLVFPCFGIFALIFQIKKRCLQYVE